MVWRVGIEVSSGMADRGAIIVTSLSDSNLFRFPFPEIGYAFADELRQKTRHKCHGLKLHLSRQAGHVRHKVLINLVCDMGDRDFTQNS